MFQVHSLLQNYEDWAERRSFGQDDLFGKYAWVALLQTPDPEICSEKSQDRDNRHIVEICSAISVLESALHRNTHSYGPFSQAWCKFKAGKDRPYEECKPSLPASTPVGPLPG